MFLQFIANGIIIGSIYALASLGFALIYNTTRIFHIAYASIYIFSAYMLISFYSLLNVPFFLSILLSIFFTIILSLATEQFVYQPLYRIKSSLNIQMISSLGIMIVIMNTIALIFGRESRIISNKISQAISIFGITMTYVQLWQLLISLLALISFLIFLKFSKFGIMIRAMRDNDLLLSTFGISIKKMRLILFSLSAVFVSISGMLMSYDVGVDPYIGMSVFVTAIVALIIGGVGNFRAAILGGFIIGLLQSIAVWMFSSRWQDAVTFLLLIIFLMLRPQGILGEKQRMV